VLTFKSCMATVTVLRLWCFHILNADVSNKVVVVIKCCNSVPVHMYTPRQCSSSSGTAHEVNWLSDTVSFPCQMVWEWDSYVPILCCWQCSLHCLHVLWLDCILWVNICCGCM